jgi:hypothetical protein
MSESVIYKLILLKNNNIISRDSKVNVLDLVKKFNPSILVIYSTISPYTTKTLQNKLTIPVIYSSTRDVHKRMLSDLKKYTKFMH